MSPSIAQPPSDPVTSFRVRAARRGDAEALHRLLVELGYPAGADSQTVHWLVSHPEMEVLVAADRQDRPIGMVSLSHRPQLRTSGRIATIEEVAVTADWRRKGVGSELIRRALERCKILAVKSVELHAHAGDPEIVRAFCESLGLRLTEVSVFRLAEPPAR